MKYVIISDLHSNLEALHGFLEALDSLKLSTGFHFDKLVCLGDIAGYGANPNEVIAWVREHCHIVLGAIMITQWLTKPTHHISTNMPSMLVNGLLVY